MVTWKSSLPWWWLHFQRDRTFFRCNHHQELLWTTTPLLSLPVEMIVPSGRLQCEFHGSKIIVVVRRRRCQGIISHHEARKRRTQRSLSSRYSPCFWFELQFPNIFWPNPCIYSFSDGTRGYAGAASCIILANFGSAWGTWKAGLGVCSMGVNYPRGTCYECVVVLVSWRCTRLTNMLLYCTWRYY